MSSVGVTFHFRSRPYTAAVEKLAPPIDLKRPGGIVWKIFNEKVFLVGIVSGRLDTRPFIAQRIAEVCESSFSIFKNTVEYN